MVDIEFIRSRCDELLKQAIERSDEVQIERLKICKKVFAEDDCFSDDKMRKNWMHIAMNLELSYEETNEFREYLQNRTKVKGILYVSDSEGREYPVEVILDPKREAYYQFKNGPVCKKRFMNGGFYDTYVLFDGRWVYDGGLQRMFEDTGYDYDYLRCEILKKDKCR